MAVAVVEDTREKPAVAPASRRNLSRDAGVRRAPALSRAGVRSTVRPGARRHAGGRSVVTIALGQARGLAHALLEKAGVAPDHADVTARAITLSDAWGIGDTAPPGASPRNVGGTSGAGRCDAAECHEQEGPA